MTENFSLNDVKKDGAIDNFVKFKYLENTLSVVLMSVGIYVNGIVIDN